MGCGQSKPEAVAQPVVQAQPVSQPQSGGGGGGGKRRRPNKKFNKESKFQVELQGAWQDYERQEDMLLKRAYLVGQKNVRYTFRDNTYEYDFKNMQQLNVNTRKRRDIRPPMGMRAPKAPLLPTGPMIVITVPRGSAGSVIEVNNPNNPGTKVQVFVPQGAKAGQKMAVPIPQKGETVESVQRKQQGMSTGAKVAAGTVGVGVVAAAAVGGVVLGDHLAGGDMAETIGETVAEGATEVADAVEDAAPDVLDAVEDAAEDVADWLGDAAEDVGDFVMDLF